MSRWVALAVWACAGVALAESPAHAGDAPALMPLPRSVQMADGALPVAGPLAAQWRDGCGGKPLEQALQRLQADLDRISGAKRAPQAAPVTLRISCPGQTLVPDQGEAYALQIGADGVELRADGPAGVLRGFATLRQWLDLRAGTPAWPHVRIEDAPRFAWRGVMLDPARHFIELSTLKAQLDAMEQFKLNVLHLHLSDNEGFRVESRRWPELNGAVSQGRFYTRAQIRDLLAYAAARGVQVVPEFDMPGHATAYVQAYPAVGRSVPQAPPFPPTSALDPSRPAAWTFAESLIGEMAGLFTGPYLHFGGDEVNHDAWQDAGVRAWMAQQGLASDKDVEAYVAKRLAAIVARAGKTAIGWDEVTEAGVPPDVIAQAWRGSNTLASATAQGHRTIVSAGYYLDLLMPADFHYAVDPLDPSAAGFTPEQAVRIRALSPLMAKLVNEAMVAHPLPPLTPKQAALVLGGEMPLWGEVVDDSLVAQRLWPRAAALAERFWSPQGVRDVDDMYRRLAVVQDRLTAQGLGGEAQRWQRITRLAPGDADALATLLDATATVRNMAHDKRIKAAMAGKRIVQSFNTPADAAPSDSLVARRFDAQVRDWLAGNRDGDAALRAQLQAWRGQAPRLARAARDNSLLQEALPASETLAALAGDGLDALDALAAGRLMQADAHAGAAKRLAEAQAFDAASRLPLLSFVRPQPPGDLIVAITPGIARLLEAAAPAPAQKP